MGICETKLKSNAAEEWNEVKCVFWGGVHERERAREEWVYGRYESIKDHEMWVQDDVGM